MANSILGPIVLNIAGIVLCGALGGGAGYAVTHAIELAGVPGALVAAVVGMVVATLAWAAGSSFLRALGYVR